MRSFANVFLVLFLADGSLSLLDELVTLLSSVSPLSGIRSMLASYVMILAAVVYVCLGIDRRLPKKVFLPLILFVLWCPLLPWLFPVLEGFRLYGLLAATAQFALGLFLLRFREGKNLTLTMPPAMFTAPWFSLKNTLIFGSINLLVIPMALVVFGLYAANAYMTQHTAGFMRVGAGGLHMKERIYRSDNRTIRLSAMIHVGDRQYYEAIAKSTGSGRTLVLAEGVTDDQKLLNNRIDYESVAGFLGLTPQDGMLYRGRLIEPEALDVSRPPPRAGEKQSDSTDILRADVDVSTFRAPTIRLLDTVGKQLQGPPTARAFLSLNTWAEKNITPHMYEQIMDDILHRRNREVLRYLGKALEQYDTVIIPWGALHMKEIEQDVLKRGFKLQEERERVSIDFLKMLTRQAP